MQGNILPQAGYFFAMWQACDHPHAPTYKIVNINSLSAMDGCDRPLKN
jgi:hypothetical protein